jgi:hypothetical protein
LLYGRSSEGHPEFCNHLSIFLGRRSGDSSIIVVLWMSCIAKPPLPLAAAGSRPAAET